MRIHKSVMEDRYAARGNLTFAIAHLTYAVQCGNWEKGPKPKKPKIQDHFPFKLPEEVLRNTGGGNRTRITKSNFENVMTSLLNGSSTHHQGS